MSSWGGGRTKKRIEKGKQERNAGEEKLVPRGGRKNGKALINVAEMMITNRHRKTTPAIIENIFSSIRERKT